MLQSWTLIITFAYRYNDKCYNKLIYKSLIN